MCRLSWNLGISTSWNPLGLSRAVMGLLYLFTLVRKKKSPHIRVYTIFYFRSNLNDCWRRNCEAAGIFVLPCRSCRRLQGQYNVNDYRQTRKWGTETTELTSSVTTLKDRSMSWIPSRAGDLYIYHGAQTGSRAHPLSVQLLLYTWVKRPELDPKFFSFI